MLVKNLHWILVEDSVGKTEFISNNLQAYPGNYTHLSQKTFTKKNLRGIDQRNAGLKWILDNNITDGVFYFADDDNTYDRRLFEEIRSITKIGMFPVGGFPRMGVSTPVVKHGRVIGITDPFPERRRWPLDMAVFAINIRFWRNRGAKLFDPVATPVGHQETSFLEGMNLDYSDIEAKAHNATVIYAWHTRTEKNELTTKYLSKNRYFRIDNTNLGAILKTLFDT